MALGGRLDAELVEQCRPEVDMAVAAAVLDMVAVEFLAVDAKAKDELESLEEALSLSLLSCDLLLLSPRSVSYADFRL